MPIPMRSPPSILDKIIAQRRLDVAEAQAAVPASALREKIAARAPANDFPACVRAAAEKTQLCVLAEMKRASPSKGDIALLTNLTNTYYGASFQRIFQNPAVADRLPEAFSLLNGALVLVVL